MKKIIGLENLEKDWKPLDLAFIKNISINNIDLSSNNLTITFLCQSRIGVNGWPDLSKSFFEVKIDFIGTLNLRLDFQSSALLQLSGFNIIDVSENGLEGINFEIEDYENGFISFSCKEIFIKSVSPGRVLNW